MFPWLQCSLIRFVLVATLASVFAWQMGGYSLAHDDANSPPTPILVEKIAVTGDETRTQIRLVLSGQLKADHFLLENPRRLVLDLPGGVFPAELEKVAPLGAVASLRFGNITANHARLVVELATTIVVDRFELRAGEGSQNVLIAEMAAVDEASFNTALARQRLANNSRTDIALRGSRPNKTKLDEKSFRVVIDPGHGGIDGGATNKRGSIIEKKITLSLSKLLSKELAKRGGYSTRLTRDGDSFITLSERVRIARSEKADLMISIHADSLGQSDVRGATIYTLSKKATDQVSAALAARENKADLVAGLEIPEEDEEVTDILIDLARLETKGFSRKFSKALLGKLRNKIRLINNPQRGAGFRVLKAPDVPSVLIELGYLSNDADTKLLTDENWQIKMAKLIADAIDDYRSEQRIAKLKN